MAKDSTSVDDSAVVREQFLKDIHEGFEQLDQGKCAPFDAAILERISAKGRRMLEAAQAPPCKAP